MNCSSSSNSSRVVQSSLSGYSGFGASQVTASLTSSSFHATSSKTPAKLRGLGQGAKDILTAWSKDNEYRVPGKELRTTLLARIHRREGNADAQDTQLLNFCSHLRRYKKPNKTGDELEADLMTRARHHLKTVHMLFSEFSYQDVKNSYMWFLANPNLTDDLAVFLVNIVRRPIDRVCYLQRYIKESKLEDAVIRIITDGKLDVEFPAAAYTRGRSPSRESSVEVTLASLVNLTTPTSDDEPSPSVPFRILSPSGSDSTRATSIQRSLSRASDKSMKTEMEEVDVDMMDVVAEEDSDDDIQEISEATFLSGVARASYGSSTSLRKSSVPPSPPRAFSNPIALEQPSPRRPSSISTISAASSVHNTGSRVSESLQSLRLDFGTRIQPDNSTVSYLTTDSSRFNPIPNYQINAAPVLPSIQHQPTSHQPLPQRLQRIQQLSSSHTVQIPIPQVARIHPSVSQAFSTPERTPTPGNPYLKIRRTSGNPSSQTTSSSQPLVQSKQLFYGPSTSNIRPPRPQITIPSTTVGVRSLQPHGPQSNTDPSTASSHLRSTTSTISESRTPHQSLQNIPTGSRLLAGVITQAAGQSATMAAVLENDPNHYGDPRQRFEVGSQMALHLKDGMQNGIFSNYGLPRRNHLHDGERR